MKKIVIQLLALAIICTSNMHGEMPLVAPATISQFVEQMQLPDQSLLLPDLFTFNQRAKPEQQSKETDAASSLKYKQDALWRKLTQLPAILEHDFLPGMQEAIQCIVARAHSPAQLTSVNDALDLDQQAQDHRAQLIDLISRFGQIYQCDTERSRQLYALITQELALLKSIKVQLLQIKAQA